MHDFIRQARQLVTHTPTPPIAHTTQAQALARIRVLARRMID